MKKKILLVALISMLILSACASQSRQSLPQEVEAPAAQPAYGVPVAEESFGKNEGGTAYDATGQQAQAQSERSDVTAVPAMGVIAEALVVDSKAGVKQSVKNEAFCARGGTSRRVFYVPARSGTQAMRYTGEYQIAKSKEGAETLRVTIAGRFTAAPGDIAAVSGTKIGIVGNFRVIECVRRFGESGEACEVTMQRE